MAGSDASERRQHERVEASLPCVLVGDDGSKEAFELVDLSESGVRIRCERGLPAMTRIQVAMVLPAARIEREQDAQLQTTGVVVWCHPADGGQYDTGVFFPELEEDTRALLRAFVGSASVA